MFKALSTPANLPFGTIPNQQFSFIYQSPPLDTMSTPATAPLSVLTMPIPGTKLAPEKFKGDYDYVSRFIQHYERLCDQNNVTKENERCETVTQYCTKKVAEFIEALESYSKGDWAHLRRIYSSSTTMTDLRKDTVRRILWHTPMTQS